MTKPTNKSIATGSVDLQPSGRYRLRIRVDGERKTVGHYDTIQEANRMRKAVLSELRNEPAKGALTVRKLGEQVLTKREITGAVSDPRSDWSRWRNHVEGTDLAEMDVKKVRRRDVNDWFLTVLRKVSRQTALNCLNVVRVVFRDALEQELIDVSPCIALKIPKRKQTEEEWDYLRPNEQVAILKAAAKPIRFLIGFALGTGLRAGELCALREADVQLGTRPQVIVRYGGPPSDPTKSGKIRRIPLFGVGLWSAQQWLLTRKKVNPHALFAPRDRGGFRDPWHVIKWSEWMRIKDAADIKRPFRWHDLRHSFASSLISGWWGHAWRLEEISEVLGHAELKTTQRYAHIAESAVDSVARLTSGQFWVS